MRTLTLAQAAALLGVSAGTLNVQARRGRIRATKLGHIWTVTSAEVERYRREVLGKPGWPSAGAVRKVSANAAPPVAALAAEIAAESAAPNPYRGIAFCPAPKPSQRRPTRTR